MHSNVFKCVQICSNAVSSIVRSGQLGNSGFKPGFTSLPPLFPLPWVFLHFLPPAWFYSPSMLLVFTLSISSTRCVHLLPNPTLSIVLVFTLSTTRCVHRLPNPTFSLLLLFTTSSSRPLWPLCEQIQLLPCIKIASKLQCWLKTSYSKVNSLWCLTLPFLSDYTIFISTLGSKVAYNVCM